MASIVLGALPIHDKWTSPQRMPGYMGWNAKCREANLQFQRYRRCVIVEFKKQSSDLRRAARSQTIHRVEIMRKRHEEEVKALAIKHRSEQTFLELDIEKSLDEIETIISSSEGMLKLKLFREDEARLRAQRADEEALNLQQSVSDYKKKYSEIEDMGALTVQLDVEAAVALWNDITPSVSENGELPVITLQATSIQQGAPTEPFVLFDFEDERETVSIYNTIHAPDISPFDIPTDDTFQGQLPADFQLSYISFEDQSNQPSTWEATDTQPEKSFRFEKDRQMFLPYDDGKSAEWTRPEWVIRLSDSRLKCFYHEATAWLKIWMQDSGALTLMFKEIDGLGSFMNQLRICRGSSCRLIE